MDNRGEISPITAPEPAFHVDVKKYTPAETRALVDFFNAAHPVFKVPNGPRGGKLIFEELPDPEQSDTFKQKITELVPKLLAECHPLLQRRTIAARFVRDLKDPDRPDVDPGAECTSLPVGGKDVYLIRISLKSLKDLEGEEIPANYVFRILHEIAENDYWLKTGHNLKEDDKSHPPDSDEYLRLEDETIANRRALRMLKEWFPEVHMEDIDYEEELNEGTEAEPESNLPTPQKETPN